MKVISFLFLTVVWTSSCGQGENSNLDASEYANNSKTIQKTIDSILKIKPLKLTLNNNDNRGDVDELILIGHNSEGSISFLKWENTGSYSPLHLYVLPSYSTSSMHIELADLLELDEGMPLDSILYRRKELVYYALSNFNIKLQNSIRKISMADLEKLYKGSFQIRKGYKNPCNGMSNERRESLSFIEIIAPSGKLVINKKYSDECIWEVYISDCLLLPGNESEMYVFVTLVTESPGFEGYARKEIELIPLGLLK